MESLQAVGILDYLEQDLRPTFVIDMASATYKPQGMVVPIYTNPAMATVDSGSLLDAFVAKSSALDAQKKTDMDFSRFHNWILTTKASAQPFTHRNFDWLSACVANRWSIISGTPLCAVRLDNSTKTMGSVLGRTTSKIKNPTFDWTDELPPLRLSPHAAWARSIDWAATSLGPMSIWSAQLRSIANLVMQDPRPAVVFYGPELIMIYNEAEIELLGSFHPCMGESARVALAPVWPEYFEPIIQRNLQGETVEQTNTAIHMVRSGFMEETYFSLKFIPILDAEGATVGHYEPLVETTRDVIAQRRSRTLLEISEELPRARNSELFWPLAIEVLSRNDKDIPFALLYAAEAESGGSSASSWTRVSDSQQQCRLRGSFGLPVGSLAGPTHLDFRQDYGFSPYFREAMAARKPITISLSPGSPAAELVKGIQWQGFGDPCREAAICPLNPTSSTDNIIGFMVIGLVCETLAYWKHRTNPRRPYDDAYLQFVLVTSRLLSTSLTSILLHEEDLGRRERAIANAEAMKLELGHQLVESQKELERSLTKFQRFAERADVGIFILDMKGVYTYRNDAWYNICAPGDRDVDLEEAWGLIVDPEYHELGQARFTAVVEEKKHQVFELRLTRTWTVSGQQLDESLSSQQPMWVITSIFPELNEDGEVIEIIGCITDISQQKWSEKLQANQALNSQESKRQLENFIDTTSHEMRNPLSAILQCADSILSSHKAFESSTDYRRTYQKILESTIDAADTIVQCSKHMKTIVDDVLTMSKLDSGLFVMTPTVVALESIARDAARMFEGEAKAADVGLEFQLEDSFKLVNVKEVSLDPTRVLQILINLITNAIKFTRLEDKRHITIRLGMSIQTPLHNADGHVQFIRSAEAAEAQTLQADWEKGEIHVIFTVEDTGRGLSAAEHELMFARFSQASPRTHIDYGGSGLGLFISRRLTEMHGGAIGFTSTKGVGSTFSFYVKGRRISVSSPAGERNAVVDMSLRTQSTILTNGQTRNEKDEPREDIRTPIRKDVAAKDLYVLIVEDNLVNQRVLAKQLRNLGMQVAVANHGGEALEHLRKTRYYTSEESAIPLSLILMDWEMPVMDGLTCVRNIRQLQDEGLVHGHVPVIAVTANVRSEQVEVALKAGMDNLISKPFRIPELYACVQKTLRDINGTLRQESTED